MVYYYAYIMVCMHHLSYFGHGGMRGAGQSLRHAAPLVGQSLVRLQGSAPFMMIGTTLLGHPHALRSCLGEVAVGAGDMPRGQLFGAACQDVVGPAPHLPRAGQGNLVQAQGQGWGPAC